MTRKHWAIALAFFLTACYNEELYPVPVVPLPPAGVRPVQPAQPPMAMPNQTIQDPGNIPGQVETHYATTENGCYAMQKRFRQEGRRLTMRRPQYVGGQLPWMCVFDGEDATDNYYGDDRYGRD